MEKHIDRLIAACGLAHFGYRPWPAPTLDIARAPQAAAATPVMLAATIAMPELPGESHILRLAPDAAPKIHQRSAGLVPVVLPSPESFDRRIWLRQDESPRRLGRAQPAAPSPVAPPAAPRSFALLREMNALGVWATVQRDRRVPIPTPRI